MELLEKLYYTLVHLSPNSLSEFFAYCGIWFYIILFLIIFAETGLVVTPFLPGDSLLFAIGAVGAMTGLNLPVLLVLLIAAAILGDAVNYSIGHWFGPKVFTRENSWLLNKKHLLEAQRFYERYGGKTIIIARFVPIVRTFAPFVAGIGKMSYPRFAMFNVVGAIVWVAGFLMAGYLATKFATHLFGGPEVVQKYFKYVIAAIIVLSVMPIVIEFIRARKRAKHETLAAATAVVDVERGQ